MWNQPALWNPTGSLPDSLEDDGFEIVYDPQPEAEPAEEAPATVPRKAAPAAQPAGTFAQSAVKPKQGRPALAASPPGSPFQAASYASPPMPRSPGEGSGTGAGAAGHQNLLAQEVHSLLHRTLEAVTQQPPQHGQQQQQQEEAVGAGRRATAAGGAASSGQASDGAVHAVQQQRPQQQQLQQLGEDEGSAVLPGGAAAEGAAPSWRHRQRPMHRSPAVLAAEPAPGEQAPRSGGRRWRPPPRPSPQQASLAQWPSQRPGRQPAATGSAAAAAASQGGCGAMQQRQQARNAGGQDRGGEEGGGLRSQAPAAHSPDAAAEAAAAGDGQNAGSRGSFFAVDDDLLAAHMHMPAPAAASAPAGETWRQAKRGKQQQEQHQQRQDQEQHRQRHAAEWENSLPGRAAVAVAGRGPPTAGGGSGLAGLLGQPAGASRGGHGASSMTQAGAAGQPAGRNPLAALLGPGGAGGGAAAMAAKKKANPTHGAGGGPAHGSAQKKPLTSPRSHTRARFTIREPPSSAPRPGSRPSGPHHPAPQQQQRQQGQEQGPKPSRLGVRELVGRAPGSEARAPAVPAEPIEADDWLEEGQGWQPQEGEQQGHGAWPVPQQPQQAQQHVGQGGGGVQKTPGHFRPPHPAAQDCQAGGHSTLEAAGAGAPPPTSFKTPGFSLRALFHTPSPGSNPAQPAGGSGSSGAVGADQGAAATGIAPRAAPGLQSATPGNKGMSLQRQFVAALAPVSRAAAAPRQRGGGGCGGLYGRLAAATAAEKAAAALAAHGGSGRAGAQQGWARLEVLQREMEANLTKCICRVEGVELSAAGSGAAGEEPHAEAAIVPGGTVVALFQSRTSREVDLVPGSCVVVQAPWRMLRVAACAAPIMLCCSAVSQG